MAYQHNYYAEACFLCADESWDFRPGRDVPEQPDLQFGRGFLSIGRVLVLVTSALQLPMVQTNGPPANPQNTLPCQHALPVQREMICSVREKTNSPRLGEGSGRVSALIQ